MKLRDANLQVYEKKLFHTSSFMYFAFIFSECITNTSRSSRPEVFCKKGVLRNVVKFTGKHLCQSLFFNKNRDPGLGEVTETGFEPTTT